jgi:hypothetical protein
LLEQKLDPEKWNGYSGEYPDLVKEALPGRLLGAFEAVCHSIDELPCPQAERDFFTLAVLSIMPRYSRAEPTGGWLKWLNKRTRVESLPRVIAERVEWMTDDLRRMKSTQKGDWQVSQRDVRRITGVDDQFDFVITSPPYPNRHDYTRVFGVELMFAFLDWKQTRQLRYQSFHSHPEARPKRPEADDYREPPALRRAIAAVKRECADERIPKMLRGYFLDMFIALAALCRVCQKRGRIVLVLGNAQYSGVPILVDEYTAAIAKQAGLQCERIAAARFRGNSAQQMGALGLHPSRESVVILQKA